MRAMSQECVSYVTCSGFRPLQQCGLCPRKFSNHNPKHLIHVHRVQYARQNMNIGVGSVSMNITEY